MARANKASEQARLQKIVPMTVGDIEDIIAEMESLIGWMDGYFSCGGCASDAEELISRLRERTYFANDPQQERGK